MDTVTVESVFRIALGCVVLFVGRNLFWLFIGLVGFIFGFELAGIWLADKAAWLMLLIGILTGLAGAILAIVLERVAFALAGFYASVYLAIVLPGALGLPDMHVFLIILIGCLGALLAALVMDWMIIILSALAGAVIIVSTLGTGPVPGRIAITALTIIGALVQRTLLAKRASTWNAKEVRP
jgi:hypothetical protein